MTVPDAIEAQIDAILAQADHAHLSKLLRDTQGLWFRLDGPQRQAMESEADVVLYGGAAGGGKTDLALGLALTQHLRTLFIRREGVQLSPAFDRLTEIIGHREGFNSQSGIWKLPEGRQIQFGGVPDPGNETKYQGNPRDLLVLDEAANLREAAARFLMGWVRSTTPGQRCRTLMCSNPPTSAEGEWLIAYFAPWLQKNHPNPAEPGEIRWFASINGKDVEVADGTPFLVVGDGPNPKRVYDYQNIPHSELDVVQPQSRTFIPSKISDNPFLMNTGYKATLQSLPEPLRSQMLYGDFLAGREDGARQVFPTAWVEAAMNRWEERLFPGTMSSMGCDVSRGGRDDSVITRLHEKLFIDKGKLQYTECYFNKILRLPGREVPDGPTLGAEIILYRRDEAPVHVDAIGVGTSVVDFLRQQGIQVEPITGSETKTVEAQRRDRSGVFKFKNMRTAMYWLLREALDPSNREYWIMLPPDPQLKADLCSLTYEVREGNVLSIISKDKLEETLGRSTDTGDAVAYAWIRRPKRAKVREWEENQYFDSPGNPDDEDGGY